MWGPWPLIYDLDNLAEICQILNFVKSLSDFIEDVPYHSLSIRNTLLFLMKWLSVFITWLASSMKHLKFPAYWILFMKWKGKFDFSVTSQNLMECLLWLLSAIYAPHSVQMTSSKVSQIPTKSTQNPDFYVFDPIFVIANGFRFLIEYLFKSNIPIMVIYSNVPPIPSAKRVMHSYCNAEKKDVFLFDTIDTFWHYWMPFSDRIPF